MHGTKKNVNFANAQQAKQMYQYKNIKKLYKPDAVLWCKKNMKTEITKDKLYIYQDKR
jgi:hypothetical protein